MIFDLKRVTLGNLMSMLTVIVSCFLAYSNIKSDVNVIKNDIAWIKAGLGYKDYKIVAKNK